MTSAEERTRAVEWTREAERDGGRAAEGVGRAVGRAANKGSGHGLGSRGGGKGVYSVGEYGGRRWRMRIADGGNRGGGGGSSGNRRTTDRDGTSGKLLVSLVKASHNRRAVDWQRGRARWAEWTTNSLTRGRKTTGWCKRWKKPAN